MKLSFCLIIFWQLLAIHSYFTSILLRHRIIRSLL